MVFCDSVSTKRFARTSLSSISSTSTETACGTSSFVSRSACSRTSSAIWVSTERSVRCSGREVERPFRQEPYELVAQLTDAVAGLRAHRMQRVELAEHSRGLHLRRDVARLQAVDLVDGDHDRDAEGEDA